VEKFFAARGFDRDRAELRAFAMAAVVCGVPLRPTPFFDRRSAAPGGQQRKIGWLLEAESPDGTVEASKLWQQWRDPAWREANPDAPITLLRAYWDALQEAERREPDYAELEFTKGNRAVTVPAHWPKEKILAAIAKL
jgi:hypothetical protein